MGLPSIACPTEEVDVGGQTITVRGLTRGETLEMQRTLAGGADLDVIGLEVYLIAHGTDTPLEEARAWHAAAPSAVVEPLTSAISRLSGLLEDADGRPTETPSSAS